MLCPPVIFYGLWQIGFRFRPKKKPFLLLCRKPAFTQPRIIALENAFEEIGRRGAFLFGGLFDGIQGRQGRVRPVRARFLDQAGSSKDVSGAFRESAPHRACGFRARAL